MTTEPSSNSLKKAQMNKKVFAVPTFQQRLFALMAEVVWGKAHFHLTRALKGTHPAIVKTAPTFFMLSAGAHADSTLLHAARIFDRHPRSGSIHTLLASALKSAGTFKNSNAMEVRRTVVEVKQTVREFEPMLEAIRTRRDETLAHLSHRPLMDPNGYIAEGRVSYRELGDVFDKTEVLLNRFSYLYDGRKVPLDLPGLDDVEGILTIVLDSLREKAKEK